MGDTTKVVGQQEVGRCPGWRHHPWNSENGSFAITGWELYTMVELFARYGISRKTGYKWLARFEEAGRQGLPDRSRAPHHCPHRISHEVAALICTARRQHPSWGPAKLLAWLEPQHPALGLPAISTAGNLLARRGLVKKRQRCRHSQHPGVVPPTTTQPN